MTRAETSEQQQANLMLIISTLFQEAPEQMLEAAAVLVDGSPDILGAGTGKVSYTDWVDDNLDIEEVVRLLFPFLRAKLTGLGEAIGTALKGLDVGLTLSTPSTTLPH